MMTKSTKILPRTGDSDPAGPSGDALDGLADQLATGLQVADSVVCSGAWPAAEVGCMRLEALALDRAGVLAPAAIGRGASHLANAALRGDRTAWLDALDAKRAPALAALAHSLDALRVALDQRLLLGLSEVEAHLACYPPGTRYARHLDRFADHDARVLSLVLYLNEGWRASDGGALRLHLPTGARDVLPESGTLVAFLSDRVAHEVLPATRPRWSVAAWFRRRSI